MRRLEGSPAWQPQSKSAVMSHGIWYFACGLIRAVVTG